MGSQLEEVRWREPNCVRQVFATGDASIVGRHFNGSRLHRRGVSFFNRVLHGELTSDPSCILWTIIPEAYFDRDKKTMDKEIIPIAVALIRKNDANGTCWLGRRKQADGLLTFVIGQAMPRKSLRESITAEVAWEFDLDRGKDFLVSNMAQLNFDFPESVPAVKNAQPLKVSFYNIEIYRRGVLRELDEDSQNQWLTSTEIWDGQAVDGQRLDPLVHQLITRSEAIRSWETSTGKSD